MLQRALKRIDFALSWRIPQSVLVLPRFPSPLPLFCLRYSLFAFLNNRTNQCNCGARMSRFPRLQCRGRWKGTLCRGIPNCWPYIQYMKGKMRIRHTKKLTRTMTPLSLCSLELSRPSWTSGGQVHDKRKVETGSVPDEMSKWS